MCNTFMKGLFHDDVCSKCVGTFYTLIAYFYEY